MSSSHQGARRDIAIDDFGTGYSSLDTLRAFPFDKIKLDRSFMREIETSPQAMAILRAVLALGRSLASPLSRTESRPRDSPRCWKGRLREAQGYLLGRRAAVGDRRERRDRSGTDADAVLASVSAKARASLGVKAAHFRSEPPQRLAVGL